MKKLAALMVTIFAVLYTAFSHASGTQQGTNSGLELTSCELNDELNVDDSIQDTLSPHAPTIQLQPTGGYNFVIQLEVLNENGGSNKEISTATFAKLFDDEFIHPTMPIKFETSIYRSSDSNLMMMIKHQVDKKDVEVKILGVAKTVSSGKRISYTVNLQIQCEKK